MVVHYKNNSLKKSVKDLTSISKHYGTKAKSVNQRIKELEAAHSLETMRQIPAANCHELKGELKGMLAVDISANYRIIFEPLAEPVPKKKTAV